jgi:hypothetical protein
MSTERISQWNRFVFAASFAQHCISQEMSIPSSVSLFLLFSCFTITRVVSYSLRDGNEVPFTQTTKGKICVSCERVSHPRVIIIERKRRESLAV